MRERARPGKEKAGWAALGGGALLFLGKLLTSRALSKALPAGSWVFWLLVLGAGALVVVGGVWLARRIRRPRSGASRRERHALGEGHDVHVIDGASTTNLLGGPGKARRRPAVLRFADDGLALDLRAFRSQRRVAVPYGDVDEVAFRPDRVVVRHRGSAFRGRIEIVGLDWGPRQDLEWEFAVRCPDAVERGNLGSVSPATGADSVPPASAGTDRAPRDAAEAVSRLDDAMAGLGAAMAPPVVRPNPAPPRSGLGCGLFPPPPGPRDDAQA